MKVLIRPTRIELKKQFLENIDIEKFTDQFEKVGKGWAIYFYGHQVRPKYSTNDYFASEKSAIASMARNMEISGVINDLFLKNYGFSQYSKECRIAEGHSYDEDNNIVFNYNKTDKEKLNNRTLDFVSSFGINAIKSTLIPALINNGIIVLKEYV
tara:strand:+ start:109 stop:573 length:465 start_codon:yes stop_codon:yes gene_type:complete